MPARTDSSSAPAPRAAAAFSPAAARRAVTFSPWSADYWKARFNDDSHRKRIYEEADIRSQLYQERYPELKEPGESHLNRNFIHDNLAVGCPALFNSGEQGHNDLRNNTLLTEEPQPLSYYLQADVLAKYGLKPIPFEEIGPRKGGK